MATTYCKYTDGEATNIGALPIELQSRPAQEILDAGYFKFIYDHTDLGVDFVVTSRTYERIDNIVYEHYILSEQSAEDKQRLIDMRARYGG